MTSPEEHVVEDLGNPLTYVVVTVVLLVLTAVNIGQSLLGLGAWSGLIALIIASVEVVLMALVFMRLHGSPAMTRLAALAGLLWLGILLVGTLDDILTRGWLPIPGK